MGKDESSLVELLLEAGISRSAIEAAWPKWWTDEAAQSPSGRAELRFAIARRLGLEPKPLLGERVEFVWNDEALFKNLSAKDELQKGALTSFGMSIGGVLLRTLHTPHTTIDTAEQLRGAILAKNEFVDLRTLIATCWAIGIPVIYLRVFPLEAKSMHAMAVRIGDRYAILLGRNALYPAPVAFTLAHELGHIVLRHLADAPALVDLEDPARAKGDDEQENEADRFALTLLTGSSQPLIETNVDRFNAPTLARSALTAAKEYAIEPGTLALCLAYQRNAWPAAMAAMRFIYSEQKPTWKEVNGIAHGEINWEALGDGSAYYLEEVMTGNDG